MSERGARRACAPRARATGLARGGVLADVLRIARRRDHGVDSLVGERPLEQRLRPGRDSELAERRQRVGRTAGRAAGTCRRAASSRSLRRRARPREEAAPARTRARAGCREPEGRRTGDPKRPRELAERRRLVVRDAEAVDPSGLALLLEPGQVLLPRDEVVHLLDLDPSEPAKLVRELRAALLDRVGPDLRRDGRLLAPASAGRARATPRLRRTSATSRRAGSPSSRAVPTTSRASSPSPSNVFQVPSPTTGPRRRSSIRLRAARRACPAANAEAKNHGILVRPPAHVLERQPCACLAASR